MVLHWPNQQRLTQGFKPRAVAKVSVLEKLTKKKNA